MVKLPLEMVSMSSPKMIIDCSKYCAVYAARGVGACKRCPFDEDEEDQRRVPVEGSSEEK